MSSGDARIYLDLEVRRVDCRTCGAVKREQLAFLADNPFYTKRFAFYVGRRCRQAPIKDVAHELGLDWHTVKILEMQYMRAQLAKAGTPAPKAIGIDEISIRKGHSYRIVVSDLIRHRPIWFGGEDRSQASMAEFYKWLGDSKNAGIRLAVMDMWKPFAKATREHAPQAAILFDKFHIMRHLGEALDKVRKKEYARLSGKDRRFIKGQKYTLLSRRENLSLDGRQALKTLLAANKRLSTAYLLKESFDQLWSYEREVWARRFFENWRASLKWQRLEPYEKFADMIDRHWDGSPLPPPRPPPGPPRPMWLLPVPELPTAMTFSRRSTYSERASSITSALFKSGNAGEVEAVEALHGRELGGLDAAVDHAPLTLDDLGLDQPQQIARIVDALGGALAGELVVLAQERRQLQRLEVVSQKNLRGVGHDAAPARRSM